MAGAMLDTGVFIALERRQRRALALWTEWARTMTTLTVTTVVIAKWWRDPAWDAARWLGGVDVEPVDEALARIAGEVLGELRPGREHTIDAIVMASAAQRGDILYTSDFADMARLAIRFPGARMLAISAPPQRRRQRPIADVRALAPPNDRWTSPNWRRDGPR